MNKIWVLGGFHDDGSPADIEVFDPISGVWSVIPYPFSHSGPAFTVSNGLIYAVGGLQSCQVLVTAVEEYDPVSGTLKQLQPIPIACHAPGICSTGNGKIYVMGGCTPPTADPGGPQGSILNTVQIYDPSTNSWGTGAPMSISRYQFCAVPAPNGNIYAIGGFDGHSELSRLDIYKPAANTWQALNAPMPTPRRCLASVLASDGKIYAIGGLGAGSSLATVEVFDPVSITWTTGFPLASGRWYLGAACSKNKIFALGGLMRTGPYQPDNANVSVLATVEQGTIT
jgi:N-acetylneuraminic acid mutarotase